MKRFFEFILIIVVLNACNSGAKKDRSKKNILTDTAKKASSIELEKLNASVSSNPSNPNFYNIRANYFLKKKELEKAYNDLKFVFTLDSVKDEYYNTLAEYHILNGEPGKAEFVLKKSIKKNPKSYSNRIKLGELYYLGKKYKLSFKYLNEGLRINKYIAKAYYIKGLDFKEMGKLEESNSNFQTAIEQDPDFYEAYIELALSNFRKNLDLSKQYYQSALRVKSNSIDALYGLGFINQSENKYNEALKFYQNILKIDSNYKDALYNIAVIYYSKSSIDSSILYVDKLINIERKMAEAYALKGLCKKAQGNSTEGNKLLNKALDLSPSLQMAKDGLKN